MTGWRPPRARTLILALLVPLGVSLVPSAASALVIWTLTGSPLTARTNESTTFTLTATSAELLTRVGCIRVDTTNRFDLDTAAITSTPAGSDWIASTNGSVATVRAASSGDRLGLLQSVHFTVRATALVTGLTSWSGTAYADHQCGGSALLGLPLVTIAVSEGPPLPTPVPTPTPIPLPTPTPIAIPTPTVPPLAFPTPGVPVPPHVGPGPVPPLPPGASTPAQPSATPRATPAAGSSAPTPSAANGPSARPADEAPAGGRPAPGGELASTGGGSIVDFARVAGFSGIDGGLGLDLLGLLGGINLWFVPAAAIGAPGLLVILWVLAQAIGTMLWVPITRRLRDDDDRRRRRLPIR